VEGLTFDEITSSVTALCARSADPFVAVLEHQRDELVQWLTAITAAPDQVAVPAVPWSSFEPYLPCLLTGNIPDTVNDPYFLGPIQDAVILYSWKHIVDRHLTSPVPRVSTFFSRYLDLIAPAIPTTNYLGFTPPPQLFSNAPFHFPIHGGWLLLPDWFSSFQIDLFVSPQACLWDRVPVDIQDVNFVVSLLRTVADYEALAHHQHTPVLAVSLLKAPAPSTTPPALALRASIAPPQREVIPIKAAPNKRPVLAPAPLAVLHQQIEATKRAHQQAMAALQAKLKSATSSNAAASLPPRHPARRPPPHEVINIDAAVSSPMKGLSFDAFKTSVKQYSPAPAEGGTSDHSNRYSSRQALFAQEQLQPIRWHKAVNGLLSPSRIARVALMNSKRSRVF
jgi:hypothetical protein